MRYLLVSSSLDPTSRSRALAHRARAIFEAKGIEVDVLDLRDHPLPFCAGRESFSDSRVRDLQARLVRADGILCAVPIYTFTVSAAFKNLVELAGRDAWTEKVVGFLCAAGGKSSYMAVMTICSSLMLDFRTVIVPRFVYASREAFSETGELVDPDVEERVERVVADLVRMTSRLRVGEDG
jgi:FMN reductase